eukprot:TRINITY_DN6390_c0_g1_i2.p1 TRINITY_DN6390_c0_g1~~TRINITY_DN6390_c0_g1_i2.p1  ORF type:complete len:583 (-),score=112.25 TRINITY_DN6390_c0_g1_i2:121-1725(-)
MRTRGTLTSVELFIVILFPVIAILTLVAVGIFVFIKRQRHMKHEEALLFGIELQPRETFIPGDSVSTSFGSFPLSISSPLLQFGFSISGAPVDTEARDTLLIKNKSSKTMSWKLFPPVSPKFMLKFEPESGVLQQNVEITITARLIVLCTTIINTTVPLAVCQGGKWVKPDLHTFIKVSVESAPSVKLDPDEFELIHPPIGDGAYGTVYKGHWRGQEVAIKVLKDQGLLGGESDNPSEYEGSPCGNVSDQPTGKIKESPQENRRKRKSERLSHTSSGSKTSAGSSDSSPKLKAPAEFVNEVKVLESLKCPQIVNFIGACFIPGRLAIVTELCHFGNIMSAMTKEHFSTKLKFKCMVDCAKGMNFLHHSSMLHRDLKPDNLLVVSLNARSLVCCKISDMGCTRGFNRIQATQYYTANVGTPIYMAPEIMNSEKYSTAADVYSFSMSLYQIFLEDASLFFPISEFPSRWKICEFIASGKRPTIPGTFPSVVRSLVTQGWSHDPHERPSFAEMVSTLDSQLKQRHSRHSRHHNFKTQ